MSGEPAGGPGLDGAWLRRVAWALAAAAAVGALVFLAGRGAGAVALFVQNQQQLQQVAGTLSGGIEGLPAADLREVRRRLQLLDAEYERLSLVAGALAALVASLATYLRLEQGAARARHRG